jgi:hypothetical protein
VVKAIETNKGGERAANVSVAELFALAAALNIGPAHLLTPVDDSELVSAPGVPELRADNLRAWVRGMLPLDWREWADFLRAWPDSELRRELRLGQRRGVQVRVSPAPSGAIEGGFGESLPQELDPFLNPKAEELADAAAWEITHGEAVRRGLEDATPDIRHAEERDPERKETENNG